MLQAQEWLFRSGEAATTGFLIFEGNVSCYRQQEPAQVAVQLLAGDYIPASLLQLEGSYTFDCKANQALTVLQLDTSAVQQMDEASQLTLHKNLMPTFNRLFTQLAQTSPSQGAALATDATAVAAALLARQAPYLSAISLQTMLANLPKLPPYSTKITSLMSDPNANTRTIVEIARQDPSLTASVLSTVNSAWFGLTHKIKDFQHAVMMLGFNQMQQLLINTGVQSTMPNTPEFRQLQAHSMMISVLCSEISLTLKAGSAQMLSTLGILHDIGKSVVLLLRR
jgi:CRP-like cAMP-binding protein